MSARRERGWKGRKAATIQAPILIPLRFAARSTQRLGSRRMTPRLKLEKGDLQEALPGPSNRTKCWVVDIEHEREYQAPSTRTYMNSCIIVPDPAQGGDSLAFSIAGPESPVVQRLLGSVLHLSVGRRQTSHLICRACIAQGSFAKSGHLNTIAGVTRAQGSRT